MFIISSSRAEGGQYCVVDRREEGPKTTNYLHLSLSWMHNSGKLVTKSIKQICSIVDH